jgi:competence protein ComEA
MIVMTLYNFTQDTPLIYGSCARLPTGNRVAAEHAARRRAMRRLITASVTVALLGLLLLAPQPARAEAPVNINTASATELAALQGIGPAKAQAIVDHREKNGQFKSVDDLKLVHGIGDKMLEQLRPHVTVDGKGDGTASNPATANTTKR